MVSYDSPHRSVEGSPLMKPVNETSIRQDSVSDMTDGLPTTSINITMRQNGESPNKLPYGGVPSGKPATKKTGKSDKDNKVFKPLLRSR